MRLGTVLLLHLVAFTLCIRVSTGKTLIETKNVIPNPVRYLKGAADQGGVLDAAEEERGWQDVAEKLENTNILKNEAEFKDANAAKLENIAEKLKVGEKLKAGNSAKMKWSNALTKLKEEGKLTEEKEGKVVKVTEEAAEALKKNPKKWPYIKKALEISFGAVLTAIIVVGIYGVIGTS
ncbi:hypothetical protein P3T76_006016 [Phytophthora citrophthora]|uniref:RxLR effector protein n=1 Tax=Phytophthora citrophthora TaxID=4793 RepID=A0AAD9LPA7_9STRA|nr:hypothetical protein P3T76_006016 [Phytophthora citrophthora]